mgnify:CR=1 FL=1|jgi:hypothetical protein
MNYDHLDPCPSCGAHLRARNPSIHRLLCPALKEGQCKAAYRCGAQAGSGVNGSYCEKEYQHEGSHKSGCMSWSGW